MAGNSNGSIALVDTASNGVTLNVGGNNASTTYSGGFSGGGGLTKIGSGMLTLAGPDLLGGPMTVSSGTLQVTGNPADNMSVGAGDLLWLNATTTNPGLGAGYLFDSRRVGNDGR